MSSTLGSARDRDDDDSNYDISLEAGMQNLMQDETFSDVKLRGTDGVLVLGNRRMLAARSKVFQNYCLVILLRQANPSSTSILKEMFFKQSSSSATQTMHC